jgi:arylformamidase
VSGIYDLEPVRRSARNSHVGLDDALVGALSPARHVDKVACPVVVAFGHHESDELKRQGRDFAAALGRRDSPVQLIEAEGVNHFEVINTLAKPTGLLGRIALAQMGLSLG